MVGLLADLSLSGFDAHPLKRTIKTEVEIPAIGFLINSVITRSLHY